MPRHSCKSATLILFQFFLSYDIYTLLILLCEFVLQSFPVIFAVMQSKKKAAYVQLLEYIKLELCPLWDPSELMMDFEKSLRLAVQEVYPGCQTLGCYFHYTQVSSFFFSFSISHTYCIIAVTQTEHAGHPDINLTSR